MVYNARIMGTFISRVIIIGLGLIGGSLGLALKKRGLAQSVLGVDSNAMHLETALRIGAIDEGATDPAFFFDRADAEYPTSFSRSRELVVVCTPVGSVAATILDVAESTGERPILITDVGSTKRMIQTTLREKLPAHVRYVGSHPIAGSEKSGPQFADSELFAGKLTVLTPHEKDGPADVAFLEHFWNALGSSVIQIPPEQHDAILARTSHLPHLLSILMMRSLQVGDHFLAGTGFRGVTRLASGDPTVWADIFLSNREACFDALQRLEKQLELFRKLLEIGDWQGLFDFLNQAKKQRDALER